MSKLNKNQKREPKKGQEFLIINNVFKFSKPSQHFKVASHLIGTGGEGLGAGNFEWPEFIKESDRIKHNTHKYNDKTIVQAFSDEYNINIDGIMNSSYANTPEYTPRELKIGDIITVNILDVQKRNVLFDSTNSKTNLISNIDLHKYARFRNGMDGRINDIEAEVIDVNKFGAKIDIIKPMIDNYVKYRVKYPWRQKTFVSPSSNIRSSAENGITVKVCGLKLTRGGFIGKVALPNVSNFLGEPYLVDAFIPGSQIVLNIADDFEKFVGTNVDAFIVNYMKKPGTNEMSLVCSVKEYLKYQGEKVMINMFNNWCENNKEWKQCEQQTYEGVVTGVINSSKKCGVFVEIPSLNITGMVATKPEDLVKYYPNSKLNVKIAGFEEEMYFNQNSQQMQHVEPYKITMGCIESCTLKPILVFQDK